MKVKLYPLLLLFISACTTKPTTLKYQDPALPVEERVNDLVSRMTLEQKASQLIFKAPAIDSLGIAEYNWWEEGLHGVARNGLATSFPQAIGLSATWDKQLMHEVASAISDEARAKYNYAISRGQHGRYQGLTYWSPNINIFRDPRWGRGMETYGEDPYLTGQMGVQFIKGMQGDDANYYKVIATAKHYAVHSGPESERHTFNVDPSEYDLRETYLPAFKMSVVDGKVGSLMCAYNSLRGKACCSNDPLLDAILRKEWGFNGYVVSDCGAINDISGGHKQAKDASEASALAVKAGTDLECGFQYTHLVDAVKRGLIKESELDVSLKRLMAARFKLGMFDPTDKVAYNKIGMEVVDSREHQQLALKAAREAIVLLKNEILPLKKDVKTIAVIGPNANDLPTMMANYNGFPSNTITPLQGIKNAVSKDTKVLFEPGCEIAQGMPLMQVIEAKYLFTGADMKEHGMKADYYGNDSLGGNPIATQVDTIIDLDQWNGAKGNYSVAWNGYIVPPVTGKYRLGLFSGNNFEAYISDTSIFSDMADPDNDYSMRQLTLEGGKPYKFKVEVAVDAPKSQMQLVWYGPDADREKRAIEAAKQADVVVFCGGLSPKLEGEEMNVQVPGFAGGDRTSIDLPATQANLLKKLAATGKPVVLVLVNGSALSINWESMHLPAIVESWYGGQAGGTAIADVLFGDYNPSGKLPVTFYKSVSDLGDFHNYNMKGKTYRYYDKEPLYPFGYGLSYTTFMYRDARVSGPLKKDGTIKVSVDIKNVGERDGEEVAQLYVKGKGAANGDANKTLKGFERVAIKKGETKTVEFTVDAQSLTFYKEGTGYHLEKGEHTLLVGPSSANIDLREVKVVVE